MAKGAQKLPIRHRHSWLYTLDVLSDISHVLCFPPGLPDELIQKGKDIKGVTEVVQNGDHFKLVVTTGTKVITNEFTLGVESELETMTGEKVKVGMHLY